MKLNDFNKKLKNEFDATISNYEVNVEKKKKPLNKLWYLLSLVPVTLFAILFINLGIVNNYNKKIDSKFHVEVTVPNRTSKDSGKIDYFSQFEKKKSLFDYIGGLFLKKDSKEKEDGPTKIIKNKYGILEDEYLFQELKQDYVYDASTNSTNTLEDVVSFDSSQNSIFYSNPSTMFKSSLLLDDYEEYSNLDFEFGGNFIAYDGLLICTDDRLTIYSTNNLKKPIYIGEEQKGYKIKDGFLYYLSYENFDEESLLPDNDLFYDGFSNPESLYTIHRLNLVTLKENTVRVISSDNVDLLFGDECIYFLSAKRINDKQYTNIIVFDEYLVGKSIIKKQGLIYSNYSYAEINGVFVYALSNMKDLDPTTKLYYYDLKKNKEIKVKNNISFINETNIRFLDNKCYVNIDDREVKVVTINNPSSIIITKEVYNEFYFGSIYYFKDKDINYAIGITEYENRPKITLYKKENDKYIKIGKSLVLSKDDISLDDSSYLIKIDDMDFDTFKDAKTIAYYTSFFESTYLSIGVNYEKLAIIKVEYNLETPFSIEDIKEGTRFYVFYNWYIYNDGIYMIDNPNNRLK